MGKLALGKPKDLMINLRGVNTPAKCINADTPALSIIRKDIGEAKLNQLIKIWIADMNDFLNISRKMNLKQAEQTATMIIEDFYYLNIADINLVFTRAKKGHYGNLYESLDGMKIYTWFDQYSQERAQIAYNTKLKEHDLMKSKNKEIR